MMQDRATVTIEHKYRTVSFPVTFIDL